MSAPAEAQAMQRTDLREYELHQILAHNREHWEGQWSDRHGNALLNKQTTRALRELHEGGYITLVPGPVEDHFYVRLTAAGHAALAEWSEPRGRWARR
jgi:hypothetical protein